MEDNKIFRNYQDKIKNKLYQHIYMFEDADINTVSNDINNLINFFNWCFKTKNNFFVTDFNSKSLNSVLTSYNQIKSNILLPDNEFHSITDFLKNIPVENLKVIKFILWNYINNLIEIEKNSKNNELCQNISKESLQNSITFISKSMVLLGS